MIDQPKWLFFATVYYGIVTIADEQSAGLALSERSLRGDGTRGTTVTCDRCARRLAHPTAARPVGNVPAKPWRRSGPDLSASAEIRARVEPRRRLAFVRLVAGARRADQLLLR